MEDDPDVRWGILEVLKLAGFETNAASNAEEALVHIRSEPTITVMLTDIYMPGETGVALMAKLHSLRTEATALEVVVLTGHGSSRLASDAAEIGVFAFLLKPAGISSLVAAMQGAHHAAMARRQAAAAG